MCKDIIQVGQFHIIGLRGYQYVLDKLSRNLHGTCHCMYLQDSTDKNNCSYLECGVKSHEQVNLRLRPRCISQLDDTSPLLDGREKQGTFSPGKGVCGKYYYYYVLWPVDKKFLINNAHQTSRLQGMHLSVGNISSGPLCTLAITAALFEFSWLCHTKAFSSVIRLYILFYKATPNFSRNPTIFRQHTAVPRHTVGHIPKKCKETSNLM